MIDWEWAGGLLGRKKPTQTINNNGKNLLLEKARKRELEAKQWAL